MHELSIVSHVIKLVENMAEEQGIEEIAAVRLEFGEVSGIVPEYLEKCWNWSVGKGHPVLEKAAFDWEITPAVTICMDCKKTYETVRYGKTCPHCGSGNTFLLQGNGINLKELVVRDHEERRGGKFNGTKTFAGSSV